MNIMVLRDIDYRHVGKQFEKVVTQLRQSDFRSADVKKLRSTGIYRAKLDEKNRLLFKLGDYGGAPHLLVLEVIRNHDYAKSRFLNGGSYTDDDFIPATPENEPPSEKLTYVNPSSPVFHFLDKPLSFDSVQTAIFELPLPVIVIGPAGSGKTALTLEKVKTIPGHGLYLTRSSYLVENARSLYSAGGYSNDGQEVDFLSLMELVQTIDVPEGREAAYADFASWYSRMSGVFKLKEPHKIFEEIKGVITGAAEVAAWMSEADYLALGVRQSIFIGDDRATVYRIFERWREHMRENALFDANVVAWERTALAKPSYDFLVIDEIQDITNVELRLALATLKDKRNFLLCGDSNQIVHPNLFAWSKVKSLFYGQHAGDGSPLEQIQILHANYRNTKAVTALANRLLLVKQSRFGSIDKESNYLVESVSNEAGRVDLVADSPQIRAEIDKKTRRSTRYAIVVLRDEDKALARASFSTPLVFSVHEAKGLEYENVILFNLVSSASREFRECTAGVSPADVERELTYARARDKTDKSLDAYKFYVNALYVAMTRAVRSLLIVERDATHPLWSLLRTEQVNAEVHLDEDKSTREEWQREARRLELQGKTEQAEQIRREILEYKPVPWPVIDAVTYHDVKSRAIAKHSRDKAMQQLLFEYALTCDAPGLLPQLEAQKFRHARNPAGGREYIESTHYADYKLTRPIALPARIQSHGVDFRNPLNETPLIVAAKLGRDDLARDLLAQGADADLTDTAGRNALRATLAAWLDHRLKPEQFGAIYHTLAVAPIKVKVAGRMYKLDPRSMEWFLVNVGLVLYRRMIPGALKARGLPAFKATWLEHTLAGFPDRVLPERRKQRQYISSILSKNEITGSNPYNRHLFLRVARGFYVINPALAIDVKGSWVSVTDLMNIPLLLDGLEQGVDAEFFVAWMKRTRDQLQRHFAATDHSGIQGGAAAQ